MQSSFNSQPSQTPGMLTSGEHEQFEPVLKQISALNFQKIFHIYELTVRVSDGTNGATAHGLAPRGLQRIGLPKWQES